MRIEPSQATLQLPLIDISGLRSADTSARHAVAQQLRQACEQRGFFYISGHGVDEALIAAVFEQKARDGVHQPQAVGAGQGQYVGRGHGANCRSRPRWCLE